MARKRAGVALRAGVRKAEAGAEAPEPMGVAPAAREERAALYTRAAEERITGQVARAISLRILCVCSPVNA